MPVFLQTRCQPPPAWQDDLWQGQRCLPPAKLHAVARLVLLACAALAPATIAWAQTADGASANWPKSKPLKLQASPWLDEKLPDVPAGSVGSVLFSDRMDGAIDQHVTATGNAELRRPGNVLKADVIRHDQTTNTLQARGNVRMNRQGDIFRGDTLDLQMDSYEGSFNNTNFEILRTDGLGKASRVDFLGPSHSLVHEGMYSTCQPDPSKPDEWNPDWYIRGERVTLDKERDEGYVENGALVFGGVPIIPVPRFGFPLSDKRRSGFLPPTFNFSSLSGVEYSQPYYINIAPNRDATVATNISSKRGINLYGQFRYLEERYHGQIDANFMPRDSLTHSKRWSYRLRHDQIWPTARWGQFSLALDLNRVSDNTYWRDFENFAGTRSDLISQRLLPSTGTLSWGYGYWSAYLREQRWQTLQLPPPNNIVPPFNLSPQLHVRYARDNVRGFDLSLDLDATRFRSDSLLTGYPNSLRSYAYGRVAYPWIRPWGYLTPALEFNATHYKTDTPMADGSRSASRFLPTVSLDSGLVFERNTQMFGRKVMQTLEPRLFYAYTPYRDQQHLPVYDSALKDFNFASIFSTNPFTGNDRISNNNTLTAGVTSRWYDAVSGAELARLSVAQ
ncbi:MAG: LPS assembly protein LptD, partial [Brachymonas sp.]|nr:LPS assembly protein LptD [Brachymonas sp.]